MEASFNEKWRTAKHLLEKGYNGQVEDGDADIELRKRLGQLTAMCKLGLVTPPKKKVLSFRCPDCDAKLKKNKTYCYPEESICNCGAWCGNSKILYCWCKNCGYEYSYYKGNLGVPALI